MLRVMLERGVGIEGLLRGHSILVRNAMSCWNRLSVGIRVGVWIATCWTGILRIRRGIHPAVRVAASVLRVAVVRMVWVEHDVKGSCSYTPLSRIR